ncbi:hypothetical protein [Paraburkholderia adhaesiva]|uniref:hypothetical protein n=1 Tax=Paraburkholderia adhaesiva TaxID=2883244 RepID=UPI001F4844C1|nr:hypothetical protein [Paraburkholderia adhaesiva]
MNWPKLTDPADFPGLVSCLNELFPRAFARDAQVRIPYADKAVEDGMSRWLSGICDHVDFIGTEPEDG